MGGGFAGQGLARGCLYQTVTPVHLGSFSWACDVIKMVTLVDVRRSMLSKDWGGHQQPFCGFDCFDYFTVMMVEVVCNYVEPKCDEKLDDKKYWRT